MDKICRAVKKKMVDYIEGKISAVEIQTIEEHRKKCHECDFLIKRFSDIWSEIHKIDILEPSDSFWPGLQAKIRAVESPQFIQDKIFSGLKMMLRPAALVLILLAGIFFGYQMGNITEDFRDIYKGETFDTEISGEIYIGRYLQDFQEIPTGSPAEFYLQPISYKKD